MTSSTFAEAGITASGAADKAAKASTDLNERLAQLWSDRPEYLALLQRKEPHDKPPRLISAVDPEYSGALRKIKGTVLVSFFVGEDGRVEEARVLDSADGKLNQPTVAAVLKWKYLPAMRGGTPVKAALIVPIVKQ